jgi:type VI secretion system secreted protein VgrG
VVGPSGEEIYTDEYGRVKVRFHWDRRGEADENSSCWIRVSQQWAGGGWGFMWIPRVAQEVVIAFHEGNPDQPHIIGRVYNADHMPPYELPTEKTKSTIKTASSKGAEGFNEIRFEDKKGEEQIFIHGEKDLDVRIKNDRFEWVGKNTHLIVKQDQIAQIENERHTKVKADDVAEVGKDRHLKVTGKEAVEIGGSHSFTVKGDVIEVFKANHSEQVTQNYYLKGMGIVIESMQGITLKCGGSAVVVDQTGVTLKGTGTVTIDGPMVKIASGPGSPAASGSAGSAVPPIAPNAPNEADTADPGKMVERTAETESTPFQPEDDGEEKTWIEIELVDEEGNPVPGERYEVTLPDGQTVARGTLDENGLARIEGIDPGQCKVTFPNLDQEAWEPA